jgi:hypothetical protein
VAAFQRRKSDYILDAYKGRYPVINVINYETYGFGECGDLLIL